MMADWRILLYTEHYIPAVISISSTVYTYRYIYQISESKVLIEANIGNFPVYFDE